jgi:valyl-tRNA synthetase
MNHKVGNMSQLSDRYNPSEVEEKNYKNWEANNCFSSQDVSTQPPYSIILPPPNVTGFLHMGHALDHTIQDLLIRWKRMSGFNTMWLPGTDHAGIATQAVVERELKKEGITRHQLGRDAFEAKIWDWKEKYGDRIFSQMRKLGDSCDWSRSTFTLDEGVSKSVKKVFVDLYNKKLIYRGTRLVNWSGPLETAISDLEVEYQQIKSSLWHLKYHLTDGSGYLVIATTRPETLLGDTAVCVNPTDERYKHLIGKKVYLPLIKRELKIIADVYVDPSFGSGVVKITPAHDFNDYNIGKTHNLEFINILTRKCEINENGGPYKGLKVQEARKRILEDLKQNDLLEKEEPHILNVGHCSRTGAVVEPFLSEQWFLKMDQLAIPAKRVVESGTIKFEPESWTKTYLHWLNNIEDWCISRQLWWGHRIPVWYCQDCSHATAAELTATECQKCQSKNLKQDEDVLDTWFSSALWPFSTMGWPKETETLKTFYPTSVLVTGHDIIFFWVARMIMMGLEFKKDVPFRTIYVHGLVRDSQGRKMSKSLNNSVDPVDMINKYGTDALRFSILANLHSGKDFKFNEQRLEVYRNFMNKIWNASRFSLMSLKDYTAISDKEAVSKLSDLKSSLSDFDVWLIFKLQQTLKTVDQSLAAYRFSDAANALYSFVWYDFCDWYIEFVKLIINGHNSNEKNATQTVIALTLNRIMRSLHPFTPFITEEIYSQLPIKNNFCIKDTYPNLKNDKDFLGFGIENQATEVELVKEAISAIRNIRGENRIKPGDKVNARLATQDDRVQKILSANRTSITTLGRIENLEIGQEGNLSKCAVTIVQHQDLVCKVIIPLEGLVDIDEEIKRIQKTIEKLTKETAALSGRLNNQAFLANAAEDIVETDKQNLEANKKQLSSLHESLLRLQS